MLPLALIAVSGLFVFGREHVEHRVAKWFFVVNAALLWVSAIGIAVH